MSSFNLWNFVKPHVISWSQELTRFGEGSSFQCQWWHMCNPGRLILKHRFWQWENPLKIPQKMEVLMGEIGKWGIVPSHAEQRNKVPRPSAVEHSGFPSQWGSVNIASWGVHVSSQGCIKKSTNTYRNSGTTNSWFEHENSARSMIFIGKSV